MRTHRTHIADIMKIHSLLFLALSTSLFAVNASAETVTEYQFDIIVFENLNSKQHYLTDLSAHEFIHSSQLKNTTQNDNDNIYPFNDAALNYEHVENGELDAIFDKLDNSSRYNILMRKTWKQSAPENGATVQLDVTLPDTALTDIQTASIPNTNTPDANITAIENPATDSSPLGGTINFTFRRYIHLSTDLTLYHEHDNTGYASPDNSAELPNSELPMSMIRLQRKMRSNEVQYVDHPLLGIVVNIKRYKLETSNAASNTE